MASIEIDGANGVIKSTVSDSDLTIKGNDGGSEISALAFDMSDAGTATFNHDIKLSDNSKALFGDDSDFEVYHSGSASIVREAGAGNLVLAGNDVNITNGAMNETHIDCNQNGSVDLYHDNSIKLQTSSTGIDITGGFTATAASTITSSSAGDLLTLKSTDAGAEAGPNLVLHRDSASPANNDVIGRIRFEGEDNESNKTIYAQLTSQIIDKGSSGGEDSTFQLEVFNNGALRQIFDISGGTSGQGEIVFNQPNQDMNFVVESSSNSDALVVDAGNNRVHMFNTDGTNGKLCVEGGGTSGATACYGLKRGSVTGTLGMSSTGDLTIVSASNEVRAQDSAGNSTIISPHNFEMIPDGASEELAWAYYSRRGDGEEDYDNTKYVNVDMAKVVRSVEKLTGEKFIYTGTGDTDDGSTVAENKLKALEDRIKALEDA